MYNTSSKHNWYLPLKYNLHQNKYLISPISSPLITMHFLFCDVLPKGNQDSSKGGAGGEAPLASTKFARKATTSLSKSNKICPYAAWMVKHTSSIVRINEDDNVDGGGSMAQWGPKNPQ